jgi:hypothetical protein
VILLESRYGLDGWHIQIDSISPRTLSRPLCPYRPGNLEGLPDLVIVASLLEESDRIFSFGLAIVTCVDTRLADSDLYMLFCSSTRLAASLDPPSTLLDTFRTRESHFSACLGLALTHALLPSQRLTMLSVWYHLKAHSAAHLARRRPPTLLPPSLPPPYPS